MNRGEKSALFALVLLLSCFSHSQAKKVVYKDEDAGFTLTSSGKIGQTSSFGLRSALLNDGASGHLGKVDKSFGLKTVFDWTLNFLHDDGAEAQASLRTKYSWGNPKTLSTSKETIKLQESLISSHAHKIEASPVYLREIWIKMSLDNLFGKEAGNQTFTIGSFPFSVGRGIAFGEAFAVNAQSLGFYSDRSVDMYAPGAKLSGNLWTDQIKYNLYGTLSQNRSTSLSETTDQIYDQLIIDGAYKSNFARGFGAVDANIVTNLDITLFENKEKQLKFSIEPYVVFDYSTMQKIEFDGDAESKLGTYGFAGEMQSGAFEFGFDGAFNSGHQEVYAWDKNQIKLQTNATTGAIEQVYSHIYEENTFTTNTPYTGDNVLYRPTSGISSAMNALQIAGTTKWNKAGRFRDAYKNKYKGSMFVADASMYIYQRDLKVSIGGGSATGDVNPNTQKTGSERDYNGFVSIQEVYSGKRIKSIFLLSSLVRPTPLTSKENYSPGIEGFSDIKFIGCGATFTPKSSTRKLTINSNILYGWQHEPALKFGSATEAASNSLGLELNTIASINLHDNIKLKGNAVVFFPGQHYTDLKGTALSSSISRLIVKTADAGVAETLPTLSDDTAFVMALGLEYSF